MAESLSVVDNPPARCHWAVSTLVKTGLMQFRANSGRRHLFRLLSMLSQSAPQGCVDFVRMIEQVASRVSHAGLVILISDFIDDAEKIENALSMLRHNGHDVIVFHVIDDAEWRLPFDGMTVFQDAETGHEVVADADVVKEGYINAMRSHSMQLRDACHRMHCDYVFLNTSMSFDTALTAYLDGRA